MSLTINVEPDEASACRWMARRFLTVAEVAVALGVSKELVYWPVRSGELAAIRVGRSCRVPESAVSQYLQGAVVTPGGPANAHAGTGAT